jgi:hypothetical protein
MTRLRLAGPLFALAFYVVADLLAAQACKRFLPWWEPSYFERAYRIPSPDYHHDLARNVTTEAYWGGEPYPYRTNSLGLRDAAPRVVDMHSDSGRVLLLGDSFTEGIGVTYQATFAGILDGTAAIRKIEVLNAAVSSYSPLIYHRKARHLLERVGLEVNAIVVFLDVSDPYDEVHRYRLTADGEVRSVDTRQRPKAKAARWLRYNSVVGRAMTVALLAYEGRSSPPPYGLGQAPARWTYDKGAYEAWGARGLQLAGRSMDSLVNLARRHDASLTLVIYPWPDQIIRGDLENRHVRFWRDWARRNEVPLVNLFPLFIGSRAPDSVLARYFMPRDLHWTAAGHRLIADSLLLTEVGRLVRDDRPDVRTAQHQREGGPIE